jgi:hypothetical protein
MSGLSPEFLLQEANTWQARAEEHRRALMYCEEQAAQFLARVAVPDDYKPELEMIWNDSTK